MARSRQPKRKHQPLRTCLGCGERRPKRELFRVVRTPCGVVDLDPTGRKAGRGAYVCPNLDCLGSACKGKKLERALEISVPPEMVDLLTKALSDGLTGSSAREESER